MPGLLIIAHAPLASSLKAVAEHAFPDCAGLLQAFDVPADMPIEQIETRARDLLPSVSRKVSNMYSRSNSRSVKRCPRHIPTRCAGLLE